MTEHEHDLDLIAEYAGGADSPAAADLVATCAVCRAEFESQQRVAHWLATAPAVSMTPEERAALRGAVRPEAKVKTGFLGWSYRIATVAASVAAIVLVVNVAMPDDGPRATLTESASSTPDNRYDAGAEGGLAGATTAASPLNTIAQAPGEITTLAAADDLSQLKVEVDQLVDQAREASQESSNVTDATVTQCADQLNGRTLLVSATGMLGERAVVVHVVQGEQPEAHVYDATTCEELDLDAPGG
ncbi:MAG TPA: hypothetical protein VID03_07425 [Acidimicrobiia bacterium]|jgi:hypothetical protein